jgi:hypothetical protein
MYEYLALVENPASEAMSLAHQIREETGADMSEALSEAWSQLKGEENPLEREIIIPNPPKRRRSKATTTFEPSAFTWLLLAGGAFTLIWYLVKKEWWWRSIGKPRKLKAVIPTPPHRNNAEESVNLIIP